MDNLFSKLGALMCLLALFDAPMVHARAATDRIAPHSEKRWIAVWASSQMVPEPKNALAVQDLKDATLRQIVRVSGAGTRLRLRLSNSFGTTPLTFEAVTLAKSVRADTAQIVPESLRKVTYGGRSSVTLPAGAEYLSDPIDLSVAALDDLSVSTWQLVGPEIQTSHPGSRAASYLVHGNFVDAQDFKDPVTYTHWYGISGIEVEGTETKGTIAILGDSITDGYGVLPNTNSRWPDTLMMRLKAAGIPLSVLNLGIGGNNLLTDGLGPNAMARLDRDVFARPGVKFLIVFEGVNDLGGATRNAPISPEAHARLVDNMTLAYRQIIEKTRAQGIVVIGATIAPFKGNDYYHPDASNEADRQAVNAWIRTPGHFDHVIDFDLLLRDPEKPDRLRPDYDSGDHLHPTPGYAAMGTFVDLKLFTSTNRPKPSLKTSRIKKRR